MYGTWLKHLQFIHSCDKYLLNTDHVFRNSVKNWWGIVVTKQKFLLHGAYFGSEGRTENKCFYNVRKKNENKTNKAS